MHDFEKLGLFYLGREYDLAAGSRRDEPLLYDAKDLTTHAVCVGMTGSGKTGLCLALLEEAAIDGLPAIAIDPKGDLGNLLLAFPELRGSDFRPWIDESEAARKNLSPDDLAEQTAARWREGLAEWDEDGARIERFRSAVDIAIYTPGSSAGLPISVLRSFDAPPPELVGDADLLRERIVAAVSGLLVLVGLKADPIRSREHILISQLLDLAWREGKNLDLAALVGLIQSPPFERIGSMDLETFYPAKDRTELAMLLNSLLASPGFAGWMEGEPLNVASLLHTAEGKPRLSIMSIAHLSEAERMFFVTILLGEILAWARAQSGTSSLRAILYMDEVFGYFPPTANPPSKTPMLTLLKQARAYGLGIVLATQNPVDLDYKGLSNTGTWFLGRLQTERDKARVLEGLEGASATAGAAFDRAKMEATLAGLGNRVFLLNNVHEDRPVVFQTRWCLSYLRGPLTRNQIQTLMADQKTPAAETTEFAAGESAQQPAAAAAASSDGEAPLVPHEIEQLFITREAPPDEPPGAVYQPALFGLAKLRFVDSKSRVDCWRNAALLAPPGDDFDDPWQQARIALAGECETSDRAAPDMRFAPLPEELARPKNYAAWKKALAAHLYRNHTLPLWRAAALKLYSEPGETEGDFRVRVTERAREIRDEAVEKLRGKYGSKGAILDERIQRARERVAREKSQMESQAVETGVSFFSSLLRAFLGRKWASVTNVRNATSTARRASRAMKEKGDVNRANKDLNELLDKRAGLEDEFEEKLNALRADYQNVELEPYPLRPRKSDISVEKVALAWLR